MFLVVLKYGKLFTPPGWFGTSVLTDILFKAPIDIKIEDLSVRPEIMKPLEENRQ